MRTIIFILAFISVISVHGQTVVPVTGMNNIEQGVLNRYHPLNDSSELNKKWSVSGYIGVAMGIGFYNGSNAAFLPAQVGLQLNRRLNNNLYAFAGVSVAPAYFNFNRSFSTADQSKNFMTNPAFKSNGWGAYQSIQAGLMYVNDAKTFSVSGSIGVGRTNNPFYPAPRATMQKQSSFAGTRQ